MLIKFALNLDKIWIGIDKLTWTGLNIHQVRKWPLIHLHKLIRKQNRVEVGQKK